MLDTYFCNMFGHLNRWNAGTSTHTEERKGWESHSGLMVAITCTDTSWQKDFGSRRQWQWRKMSTSHANGCWHRNWVNDCFWKPIGRLVGHDTPWIISWLHWHFEIERNVAHDDLHEANKAFLSLATLLHARSIVFYVLKVCCFLPWSTGQVIHESESAVEFYFYGFPWVSAFTCINKHT
jgi:hypothetical protein